MGDLEKQDILNKVANSYTRLLHLETSIFTNKVLMGIVTLLSIAVVFMNRSN